MPYVGRDPRRGNYLKLDDIQSSFNGSDKTFNLTSGGTAYYPDSTLSVLVSVGGTVLEPATDYGITNNQITFTNAPLAAYNFFAIVQSTAVNIGVPGDGVVTAAKLAKPLWYDEYFKLDSNNNRVGIGVENPDALLHLKSASSPTIHLEDTSQTTKLKLYSQDSSAVVGTYSSHDLILTTNSASERVRILSTGEVLINRTTKPNDINKLVVHGTSPADAYDSTLYLEGSETSGAVNTGGALAFGGHDGSQYRNWGNIYGMKENGTGGNRASYMSFHTREAGGNPAEKVRISSAGKVGIGTDLTTTPSSVLTVAPHTTGGRNISIYTNGTVGNKAGLFFNQSPGTGNLAEIQAEYKGTNSGDLIFNTSMYERLRIASDGEVRIDGSTSANHGLRFTPGGWNGYYNRMGYCGTSGADFWWSSNWNPTDGARDHNGYATNYIRQNINTGYLAFGTGGVDVTAVERLRIDSSGRLITGGNVTPYPTRTATFQPVSGQTNTYVSIIGGSTSSVSGITFGDAAGSDAGNYAGMLEYYHADDRLTYSQNASAKVTINSTGNVGIGLTDPGEKLSVNGKIEARGGNWFISRSGDNSNYAYIKNPETAASALGFFTSGEKMRIASNGRVGINSTVPTAPLNVQAETTTGDCIRLNQEGTNKKASIYFQDATTTGNDSWITNENYDLTVYAGYGGKLNLGAYDTTGITVLSTGKVGIGSESPDSKLQIKGGSNENVTLKIDPGGTAGNYSELVIGRTSSAPTIQTTPVVKGGNAISGVPGILFGSENTNLPCVVIQTPNSSNGHIVFKPKGSEKVRIAPDGKVAIGGNYANTSTFGRQVLIDGTVGLNNDSGNVGVGFHAGTSNTYGYIGTGDWAVSGGDTEDFGIAAKGNLIFGTSSSSWSEKVRIDASGNVGINSTIPSQKLDVMDGTIVVHPASKTGVALNGIAGQDVGVVRWGGDNHHAIILRGSSDADGSTITGGNTMEFREYGAYSFKTGNNSGTMAERLSIASNGRVQIASGGDLYIVGSSYNTTLNGNILSFDRAGYSYIDQTSDTGALSFRVGSSAAQILRLDTTNAIFPQGTIFLGTQNTSSGHLNAYEIMTFNIDTDNDDTNRYFGFYANGSSSSGSELLRIKEDGDVGIGNDDPSCKLAIKDVAEHTAYAKVTPSVTDCMLQIYNSPPNETALDHATIQFGVNGGTHNRVATISAVAESASNRTMALNFCTDSGANRSEKMSITSGGEIQSATGGFVSYIKSDINVSFDTSGWSQNGWVTVINSNALSDSASTYLVNFHWSHGGFGSPWIVRGNFLWTPTGANHTGAVGASFVPVQCGHSFHGPSRTFQFQGVAAGNVRAGVQARTLNWDPSNGSSQGVLYVRATRIADDWS